MGAFNNAPAPLTLRANRFEDARGRAGRGAVGARGVETIRPLRAGRLVVSAGNPLLTPLAGDGLFFVQDEASQLVDAVRRRTPASVVLDACASPGGKTTAMAAAMEDRGLVVATDVRGRRVELLARTVAASGATIDPGRAGGRRAGRCRFAGVRLRSCSTRRARGWARSGAIRTSSGAARGRLPRAGGRAAADAAARPRDVLGPAAGSSTRPARASPRRTMRWSRPR